MTSCSVLAKLCGAPAASSVDEFIQLAQHLDWLVRVIAMPVGERFIDAAHLEALTGDRVRTGSMSSEIYREDHTRAGTRRLMTDFVDLAGKSVIVTGASSGIGASTARLLHAAGPIRCWPRAEPTGWPR